MAGDSIQVIYGSPWVYNASGNNVGALRIGEGPKGYHEKIMTFGINSPMDYGTWSPPFDTRVAATKAGQEKLTAWQKGDGGAGGGTPLTGNMEMSQESRQQALLAASGAKNANEGKALTAQPAGTDDHRTSPMTPGYQPKYGESVAKVEPPSK